VESEKNLSYPENSASEPNEPIEGGEITNFDEYKVDPIQRQKIATARWLAYALVGILAGSFVIHYGVMTWLASQGKIEALDTMQTRLVRGYR
jgi:nitrate reductase NapE component